MTVTCRCFFCLRSGHLRDFRFANRCPGDGQWRAVEGLTAIRAIPYPFRQNAQGDDKRLRCALLRLFGIQISDQKTLSVSGHRRLIYQAARRAACLRCEYFIYSPSLEQRMAVYLVHNFYSRLDRQVLRCSCGCQDRKNFPSPEKVNLMQPRHA